MRSLFFIVILFIVAIALSGCCGNCDGANAGVFVVSTEGRAWTNYARTGLRTYQYASGNLTMVAEYAVPVSSLETYTENCIVNPRCGECCDIHQGEALFISLISNAGSPVFNITMRADFINYVPSTKPDDSGDILEISANNKLTGRWRFPDPAMEPAVTIDGRTFTDVLVVEDNTITDPAEIAAFYVTQKEGIVGFKYGDGEAWARVP